VTSSLSTRATTPEVRPRSCSLDDNGSADRDVLAVTLSAGDLPCTVGTAEIEGITV
jgi:hypothetical protein